MNIDIKESFEALFRCYKAILEAAEGIYYKRTLWFCFKAFSTRGLASYHNPLR